MRVANFLSKLSAAIPKSPPNSKYNNRDVLEPTSDWMFSRNTAGHHIPKREALAKNQRSGNRTLNSYGAEASTRLKIPKPIDNKSIERYSMDQGKPTQKLDHESDHRHSRIGRNSTAPGASDQPRGVVGPVGPWGPTLNQARV